MMHVKKATIATIVNSSNTSSISKKNLGQNSNPRATKFYPPENSPASPPERSRSFYSDNVLTRESHIRACKDIT